MELISFFRRALPPQLLSGGSEIKADNQSTGEQESGGEEEVGTLMGQVSIHSTVHENISEPQLPRLRPAPRPRCQPVTHCAGRI